MTRFGSNVAVCEKDDQTSCLSQYLNPAKLTLIAGFTTFCRIGVEFSE